MKQLWDPPPPPPSKKCTKAHKGWKRWEAGTLSVRGDRRQEARGSGKGVHTLGEELDRARRRQSGLGFAWVGRSQGSRLPPKSAPGPAAEPQVTLSSSARFADTHNSLGIQIWRARPPASPSLARSGTASLSDSKKLGVAPTARTMLFPQEECNPKLPTVPRAPL